MHPWGPLGSPQSQGLAADDCCQPPGSLCLAHNDDQPWVGCYDAPPLHMWHKCSGGPGHQVALLEHAKEGEYHTHLHGQPQGPGAAGEGAIGWAVLAAVCSIWYT